MRYNNVGKTPSVPTCGTLERSHICKEDIKLYTTEGKLIEETTHDQWWLRDEEFEKVVEPYIKEHLHNY